MIGEELLLGHPRLEMLVTPELLEGWDLEELGPVADEEDWRLAIHVRYLSPSWAEVRIVTEALPGEPLEGDPFVRKYGA